MYALAIFGGFCHKLYNGLVGFFHSHACKDVYIPDGIFHAFYNYAIPTMELAAAFLHLHAKQPSFYGRSDFCSAACFCPIANHAGTDGNGIDYCVGDFADVPAKEVTNAGRRAAPCAGSAAIGGKRADACF